MTPDAPRPRSTTLVVVLVVLGVATSLGLAALGLWQLERLSWKRDLVARIERQVRAEPVDPAAPAEWPALSRAEDEYRRVRVQGEWDTAREVLVRASTELGAGHWVLTPVRQPGGWWLLVNRGFVDPAHRDRVPAAVPVQAPGLLRLSEPGGSLLQENLPAQGRWYSRDVAAIAAAQGLQGPVAPYFVDLQATPATAQAWPRPGLTVLRFPDNHLAYALTWFALAAAVAAAAGYLLVDERRQRRLAGESPR